MQHKDIYTNLLIDTKYDIFANFIEQRLQQLNGWNLTPYQF